jgi:hypothetical protein
MGVPYLDLKTAAQVAGCSLRTMRRAGAGGLQIRTQPRRVVHYQDLAQWILQRRRRPRRKMVGPAAPEPRQHRQFVAGE